MTGGLCSVICATARCGKDRTGEESVGIEENRRALTRRLGDCRDDMYGWEHTQRGVEQLGSSLGS